MPPLKKRMNSNLSNGSIMQEAEVDFELADQIFARATINDPQSVCLWLGANVMVEYSLEEVRALFVLFHIRGYSDGQDCLVFDPEVSA